MKVLAGVMNPIAFDGRVQRASEAASRVADVLLVCPSGPPVPPGLSYAVEAVDLPRGFASRFLEHPAFWKAFVRSARRFKPDVVYIHDHYLALAGVLAARFADSPLVYDAHELAIPEPGRKLVWQDRAKLLFDRIAVSKADIIVTTGPERARIMREYYRLAESPLVVQNIAHPVSGAAREREQVFPGSLLSSRPECVHVYQGHVTLDRGIQSFVEALAYTPQSHHLLVVGGGPHLEALRSMASEHGVGERVHFTGRVSRDDVQQVLVHCDIGLLSYPWTGLNNLYCTPNKTFEYANAGLPMVATAQPTLRTLFERFGIGLLLPEKSSPADIGATLTEAFLQRETLRASLPKFLHEHRWEDESGKLEQALLDVAGLRQKR